MPTEAGADQKMLRAYAGPIEGLEEMLRDHVVVRRSELEGIRRLIEVHDGFEGARLCEARRRIRLLLEMEP
jgi:hypothetical protein